MPISSSPTIRGLVRAADGRPLAGLTVRAFDRDMRAEQELGSPQQPGQTDAEVVLIVRDARLRGPAEYDRYRTELSPLVEQLSLAELSEEDIAFLAGEADIPAAHLASLGDAEGLARTTQIP